MSAPSTTAAGALLAWFDCHRRDLPWRRDRDPYRVWVSEVMLQQTRVETVIPYYERFLARFPTVEALAAAPLDEVLALWSGLGYYRRARQLYAAAGEVAAAGGFPRTLAGLLALPGIGAYTAAAVASIAFGVVVPVLDGNVERVMSRLLALAEDPKRREVRERLLDAAAGLLDAARPGDSNQGLMELGATVCLPQRPRCLLCPLVDGCSAVRAGDPERFPAPRRKRAVERRRLVAAAVVSGERLLLYRRSDASELLAGTWELPWVDGEGEGKGERKGEGGGGEAVVAELLAGKYGGRWKLGEVVGQVRHGITFRDLEVTVRRAERLGEAAAGEAGEVSEAVASGFFAPREVALLATSSLVGKVMRLLAREAGR